MKTICGTHLTAASVHQVYTQSRPSAHQVYTQCTPGVHQMYTQCTPSLHQVYTQCASSVHPVYTKCTPSVHQMSTKCTPSVHPGATHKIRRTCEANAILLVFCPVLLAIFVPHGVTLPGQDSGKTRLEAQLVNSCFLSSAAGQLRPTQGDLVGTRWRQNETSHRAQDICILFLSASLRLLVS